MKTLSVLLSALVALTLALSSHAAEQRRAEHVFIISFDQGAPRIIQQADMPTYMKMLKEGAHTWEAYTIVPSLTLPSHTSMLTGVGVQKHQVTWNDFAPEKGVIKIPTIFSLAKEAGLTTAMVAGKEKFRQLAIAKSLDTLLIPGSCTAVADAFATKVAPLKPNLCFIHFADPDLTGHQFGVGSKEQFAALNSSDKALEKIRAAVEAAGIADTSVFILTSDHGGHHEPAPVKNTIGAHGSAQSDDVLIPWIAWGKGVKKNFEITKPVVTYDTAATALWLLGVPIPDGFWGRPVTTAFE